jgi:hypothetical protein
MTEVVQCLEAANDAARDFDSDSRLAAIKVERMRHSSS